MTQLYTESFLEETARIAGAIDVDAVEAMAVGLASCRAGGGRLFVIGVGGGAGHASHAVCDFRKLAGFEAYTPVDNVSELSARTNDEGFETVFDAWLRGSRLRAGDALLVFSVGGGSRAPEISVNVVRAVELARSVGAFVCGVVGKADGVTATLADAVVVVPAPAERLTPHTEAWQAVVWHLLVSHPALAMPNHIPLLKPGLMLRTFFSSAMTGDARNFASHPSQSDQAQFFPDQFGAHEFFSIPAVLLHARVRRGNVVRQRQNHRHGVLGGRHGVSARNVHHNDALL